LSRATQIFGKETLLTAAPTPRLRIFVFCDFMPKPDQASGDRRFFALLEMMARHHDVDLCIQFDEANRRFTEESSAIANTIPRYRKMLEDAGVRILPWGWKHFGAALANKRYDVGFFEFWTVAQLYAPVFARVQPGAKIVIDSVDVAFVRLQAGVALGVEKSDALLAKDNELAVYRNADAVIVVTAEDEVILRNEPNMPRTFLLPNIVPIRPRAKRPPSHNILFIGGFKHPPNGDGVLWFVREVWKEIRTAVPTASFTIVGSYPTPEILALHDPAGGVTVTGYVPDANPYLDATAVSVAPLRYGGGMKGKVSEALGCGLPVVTTAAGAQGFGGDNGTHYFETDNPKLFAQYVVQLLQDPAKQESVGLAGQSLVANICGPHAVEANLVKMLEEVVPSTPITRTFSASWLTYSVGFKVVRPFRTLLAEGGALYSLFTRLQTRYLKQSQHRSQ
jgi:glycosyltransferase involved in cell wall biosynthesis